MRALIYPLLLASLATSAAKPEKFFVVVHTTDQVVRDFVCNQNNTNDLAPILLRSQVTTSGSFVWHVVGGEAPYTIVKDEAIDGSRCITVMDATGRTASGCGFVGVQREKIYVDCLGSQRLEPGPYGLVPNDSTDVKKSNLPCDDKHQGKYVPPIKVLEPEVDPPAPAHVQPRKEHVQPVMPNTPHRDPSPNPGPAPRHENHVSPMEHSGPGHTSPSPAPRPNTAPSQAAPARTLQPR